MGEWVEASRWLADAAEWRVVSSGETGHPGMTGDIDWHKWSKSG